MKKKGLKALGLSACLAGSLLGSALPVHADSNISVTVDGELINMDQPPIIDENSRTLVPVRFVSQSLGANDIQWDGDAQKATIFSENHKIEVTMDQTDIVVDGQSVSMDTSAKVVNGRTMIPARYVAEALGATVGWNQDSNTVEIHRAKPKTNNLDQYGLKLKQDFPVSADNDGLTVTLNNIYIYPYDSPAAQSIVSKYMIAHSPTLTPKYLLDTNITLENHSDKVIQYSYYDLNPKATLMVSGGKTYLSPASSRLPQYKKDNNSELLRTFVLNPGEKISGHAVYLHYYDQLDYIELFNANGQGKEVVVADNK